MPRVYEYLDFSGYYIIANLDGIVTFQVTLEGEEYIRNNKFHINSDISKKELYRMQEKGFIFTTGVGNDDSIEEAIIRYNANINSNIDYSKIDLCNKNGFSKKEFAQIIQRSLTSGKQNNKNIKSKLPTKNSITEVSQQWQICPICKTKVLKKNLRKHSLKVHKIQSSTINAIKSSTQKQKGKSIPNQENAPIYLDTDPQKYQY